MSLTALMPRSLGFFRSLVLERMPVLAYSFFPIIGASIPSSDIRLRGFKILPVDFEQNSDHKQHYEIKSKFGIITLSGKADDHLDPSSLPSIYAS